MASTALARDYFSYSAHGMMTLGLDKCGESNDALHEIIRKLLLPVGVMHEEIDAYKAIIIEWRNLVERHPTTLGDDR